jgi:hypothetical protein
MIRVMQRMAILAVTAACAVARPAVAATNDAAPGAVAPIRVLFIGNSLTYGNRLPDMVKFLAGHAPQPLAIEVDSITVGGAKLEKHWNAGDALKRIRAGGWTYVVLQDYSTVALTDKDAMFKHIRLFDAEIKKSGAKTLLYMTWALKKAPDTQSTIANAYQEIGREVGARVIPVGLARAAALTSNPAAAIYTTDGKHPTSQGTYLAACLFYAMLSGQSPKGLPAVVPDPRSGKGALAKLSDGDAAFYQGIAEAAARPPE